MKRTNEARLRDALDHLEILHQHLAHHDAGDQLILDAAALRLSAAIDSVALVDADVRVKTIDETSWRAIKGMRNRIAHAYGFMDPAVLRSTIEGDVKGFELDIRRLLSHVDD